MQGSEIERFMGKLQAWRNVNVETGRGDFTQVQAAKFLGCPLKTYQDWEQGRCAPAGWVLTLLLIRMERKPKYRKAKE
jgi:DNA-binding transcriptional regulator YiaG